MSASATQDGHNKPLTVKEICSWLLPLLGGDIVTTTTIASLIALYLGQPRWASTRKTFTYSWLCGYYPISL